VVIFLLVITNFRPNPNPYAYPYALALILITLKPVSSVINWVIFALMDLFDGEPLRWLADNRRTCPLTPGTVRARVAIWPHRLSFHNAVFRAQQHLHIFLGGGGAQSLQGLQMSGNCFEMFFCLNRR